MDFEVRTLTTIEEFREHERLQREVWGSDDIDVPVGLMAAGARHGAVLLGAYVQGEMVGILYGFPAITHGKLHHHSHMLGVLPEYRRAGIGLALKYRQREMVREQDLDFITWTVDPLEATNNLFNFGRLGVTCNTYLEDAYGEMEDGLNKGLPSDRFEVHWWVGEPEEAPLPRARNDVPAHAQLVSKTLGEPSTYPIPDIADDLSGRRLKVEVPLNFRRIKEDDFNTAMTWRLHLREVFQEAFSQGYTLVGCVECGDQMVCYVLEKDGA